MFRPFQRYEHNADANLKPLNIRPPVAVHLPQLGPFGQFK